MEPYVITIGRELGSGGKAIATIMAEQLHIPVYDRKLIQLAAQESGFSPDIFKRADETPNRGLMSHIIRNLTAPLSSFSNLYSNSLSKEALFNVQADTIRRVAEQESCIIVGRCSDYILRNHPRHFSIFVRANYDDRIAFLQTRQQMTTDEARQLIDRTDTLRADYHNLYAETNWGDSRAYDLCINTSVLGIERTAHLLLNIVRSALDITD